MTDSKKKIDNTLQLILDLVTSQLEAKGYQNISHKRISFLASETIPQSKETCHVKSDNHSGSNSQNYNGLSVAVHKKNITVMVKWLISMAVHIDSSPSKTNKLCSGVKNELNTELENEYNAVIQLTKLSSVVVCLDSSFNVSHKISTVDNTCNHFEYISYPYYKLGTLANFLKSKPYTPHQSLSLLQQITQQLMNHLNEIHKAGWIHGDIKPSNILIKSLRESTEKLNSTNNSTTPHLTIETLLIDFSLAKRIQNPTQKDPQILSMTIDGTPAYLAPECWKGVHKSIYSDYYALGITLYELFTGEHPLKLTQTNTSIISTKPNHNLLDEWKMRHISQTAFQDMTQEDFTIKVNNLLGFTYDDYSKNKKNNTSYLSFIENIYTCINYLLSNKVKRQSIQSLQSLVTTFYSMKL